MANDREIKIVISAQDDYSAALRKFNEAVGGMGASANRAAAEHDKVTRELHKLGNVSEYVGGGLKKVRNLFEDMAFGGVIGLVSGAVEALTEKLIEHYKVNSTERINKINDALNSQAQAWGLLPTPIQSVTQATVDLYNAQLKYLQLNKQYEVVDILQRIDDLEKMRRASEANLKAFGPNRADYFKKEIASFDMELAKAHVDYEKWMSLMGQTPMTVDKVINSFLAAKEVLKAPEGGNSLMASVTGSFKLPEIEKTASLTGFTLGGKLAEGFSLAVAANKEKFDPFIHHDLTFSMDNFLKAQTPDGWADKWAEKVAEDRRNALDKLASIDRTSPYKGNGGLLGEAFSIGAGDKYQAEIERMQAFNTQKLQLMVDAGASQYEIEAEYERQTTQMKRQEYGLRLSAASSFAGGMSNFFQNLYVAGGKHNRALFEMSKAFAIAEAVMNTALAATKALDAPPGPPWSFAYVAATIAAGAAQIATISSARPEGSGAISAGGVAMPSYSGGSYNAYPVPERIQPQPTQNMTLIVNTLDPSSVNWQKLFADNIKPAMEAVSGDGNLPLNIKVVTN